MVRRDFQGSESYLRRACEHKVNKFCLTPRSRFLEDSFQMGFCRIHAHLKSLGRALQHLTRDDVSCKCCFSGLKEELRRRKHLSVAELGGLHDS